MVRAFHRDIVRRPPIGMSEAMVSRRLGTAERRGSPRSDPSESLEPQFVMGVRGSSLSVIWTDDTTRAQRAMPNTYGERAFVELCRILRGKPGSEFELSAALSFVRAQNSFWVARGV